ncbi:hypothetical protein Back11_18000 [Paenibacillus baekrokdamisoli]|uniref:Uncharacterized protein n=1 Tax=Paenibacillus baekrokdamisoli TaxID=1712516 RepID=A0A3G9IWC8_9BACL|nr:hypothetical protein Back11_18000 [Paenibacillus baekrokdamisoli]
MCPPDPASSKCLGRTEGRLARCVNMVLAEVTASLYNLQIPFYYWYIDICIIEVLFFSKSKYF